MPGALRDTHSVRAKVTSSRTGDVLVESVLVVITHDGQAGFVVRAVDAERVLADPQVTVTGTESALASIARVVRSGTAYEEVLGRTRMLQSRLARWAGSLRRRGEPAVVLLSTGT